MLSKVAQTNPRTRGEVTSSCPGAVGGKSGLLPENPKNKRRPFSLSNATDCGVTLERTLVRRKFVLVTWLIQTNEVFLTPAMFISEPNSTMYNYCVGIFVNTCSRTSIHIIRYRIFLVLLQANRLAPETCVYFVPSGAPYITMPCNVII